MNRDQREDEILSGRILIVDDDQSMCDMLVAALKKKQYQASSATTGDVALDLLAQHDFDVVITDMNMRGMNGLELCSRIVENRPDIPVMVITAFGSLETAVAAIRAGAYDFITKPFEVDVLALALERAIKHRALREEVKRLKFAVAETPRFDEIIGESPAMKSMYELLSRVLESDASVLITGESGTGKDVIARTIHRRGRRSSGPFVPINCAAMPETLLESELFGHVKGAFTDARSARRGLFLVNAGTFLSRRDWRDAAWAATQAPASTARSRRSSCRCRIRDQVRRTCDRSHESRS